VNWGRPYTGLRFQGKSRKVTNGGGKIAFGAHKLRRKGTEKRVGGGLTGSQGQARHKDPRIPSLETLARGGEIHCGGVEKKTRGNSRWENKFSKERLAIAVIAYKRKGAEQVKERRTQGGAHPNHPCVQPSRRTWKREEG